MSHLLTIDTAVVAFYLLITLIIGIRAGRGITTMQQYTIGDPKSHTTFIVVAAIFATEVGGGSTIGTAEKAFTIGLIWALVEFG
ncbi:MAG: hypothetical protein AAF471_06215, partial [Myxococcota bacterium]